MGDKSQPLFSHIYSVIWKNAQGFGDPVTSSKGSINHRGIQTNKLCVVYVSAASLIYNRIFTKQDLCQGCAYAYRETCSNLVLSIFVLLKLSLSLQEADLC